MVEDKWKTIDIVYSEIAKQTTKLYLEYKKLSIIRDRIDKILKEQPYAAYSKNGREDLKRQR